MSSLDLNDTNYLRDPSRRGTIMVLMVIMIILAIMLFTTIMTLLLIKMKSFALDDEDVKNHKHSWGSNNNNKYERNV